MFYALTVGVCIKYLMELKTLRSSVQNARSLTLFNCLIDHTDQGPTGYL